MRIGDGVLHGYVRNPHALYAYGQALDVHHAEHRCQTPVLFADQISPCIVEIQDAGCRALDPHFVFDRAGFHVVSFADRTVVVDE